MTARSELNEHATLRRVAALVSRAAPPEEVFAAVAAEAGRLLDADLALLSRYHPDGAATTLGSWARGGGKGPLPAGSRVDPEGLSLHSLVFATGRPARLDDYGDDAGAGAAFARRWGIRSVVGVPINLQGQRWGIIGVASRISRQGSPLSSMEPILQCSRRRPRGSCCRSSNTCSPGKARRCSAPHRWA